MKDNFPLNLPVDTQFSILHHDDSNNPLSKTLNFSCKKFVFIVALKKKQNINHVEFNTTSQPEILAFYRSILKRNLKNVFE